MSTRSLQLAALASHIAQRRDSIVDAWRRAIAADPALTTSASLPRAQLNDHIPALLEDFGRKLTAADGAMASNDEIQMADAAAHGLHRWQQGFDLAEVTRELGLLNEVVVSELEDFAAAGDATEGDATSEARRIWAKLHGATISVSTSQYFKLQQLEAASHVRDLEGALVSVRELEARRAELWQQAAHDLRGNLSVVATATLGLTSDKASTTARDRLLALLERNVRSLRQLLEDVTSLARLQGGQEFRSLSPLDATLLLRELCESMQPLALERNLFLRFDGPERCNVEGDAIKIRRILQNLVLNAIKYTQSGGVTVTWALSGGSDIERWFIQVQDTGPGFHAGPGSQLVAALEAATEHAKDVAADAITGGVTHVESASASTSPPDRDTRAVYQQPGEGIGLSIVKRLCELLDATMELSSPMDMGTTIRIVLPRRYVT